MTESSGIPAKAGKEAMAKVYDVIHASLYPHSAVTSMSLEQRQYFFVCAASMVGTGLPEIQSISMREGFMSVGLIRIEVSTSV